VAFGFHVPDHRLDGGAASQFTLDSAKDAALLAGDEEDAAWVRSIMAPISLVEVGALDRSISQLVSFWVSSYRLPGSALLCSTNWPPGARALVVTIATGEILRFETRFPAENPTPHQAFAG
jgi:hypothetical protein